MGRFLESIKSFSLIDAFGGILIFVPKYHEFVTIQFGDGTNIDILSEDNDDYLMYDVYEFDGIEFVKGDGGMMEFNSSKSGYGYDIIKTVPDVLTYHYSDMPIIIPLHTFSGNHKHYMDNVM